MAPGAWRLRRTRATATLAALGLVVACDTSSGPTSPSAALSGGTPVAAAPPPVSVTPSGPYVSSRTCRPCHADTYRAWSHSYHRGMTQRPTAEGVFGAFGGAPLTSLTQSFALRKSGDRFFVDIRDRDDQISVMDPGRLPAGEREIALVTGSHHMQFYWYTSAAGDALYPLPFAYLKDEARWVPRSAVFLQPPKRFAMPEAERWNTTCIHCHTTRPEPRPLSSGGFESRVAELGVACEACHGPGAEHVTRFSSPLSRYRAHLGDHDETSSIVNPARLDPGRASQICSQCHALWQLDQQGHAQFREHGSSYRPGDDATDSMWLLAPSRAASDPRVRAVMQRAPAYVAGQYWSDGQARVSGREYSGMIESACARDGTLSCLSCHRMHQATDDPRPAAAWANDQLDVGKAGDRACTQCHQGLAASPEAHTRHAAGSPGSRCQNCHMPHTSYGLLKAIRSHQITIPSADETLETGRPNACNLCHLDRTLAWTAEQLERQYGRATRAAVPEDDQRVSLAARMALQGDAGQRALVAWHLGWDAARRTTPGHWTPALLGVLADDPYDAVRYVAHRSLGGLPGHAQLDHDFATRPSERTPLAPAIAALAAKQGLGPIPESVPLTAGGSLTAEGEALRAARDDSPIRLLE